ncbi:hypothetical protein D9M70_622550 [compost metagenome]
MAQRCTTMNSGRPARKAAMPLAASAIIALTVTLVMIWIDPKTSDWPSTLPSSGRMNCGSNER